jgi:hypothetical protein
MSQYCTIICDWESVGWDTQSLQASDNLLVISYVLSYPDASQHITGKFKDSKEWSPKNRIDAGVQDFDPDGNRVN